jgi:hypothetical protein
VCEIGDAFVDATNTGNAIIINLPCASQIITSSVNGVRTAAFHNGSVSSGYQINNTNSNYLAAVKIDAVNVTLDGIRIKTTSTNTRGVLFINKSAATVKNCILIGIGNYNETGLQIVSGYAHRIYNNIIIGCSGAGGGTSGGVRLEIYSGALSVFYNNIATKNSTGFVVSNSPANGQFFNNISVGNGTNWGATAPTYDNYASNNAGLTTDTIWADSANTVVRMATTDFVDYTNNNFRPASSNSPQVDTGASVYGGDGFDIIHGYRPSYPSNLWDVGCFEYGGVAPPYYPTVTFTGLPTGCDAVVLTAGTTTILDSKDSMAGTTYSYTYSGTQSVDVGFIKPGYIPFYIRNLSPPTTDSSIPVSLTADRNYV